MWAHWRSRGSPVACLAPSCQAVTIIRLKWAEQRRALHVEGGADAPVREAGGGQGFGGVLGDVVRHGLTRQGLPGAGQVAAVADGPGVGLRAEAKPDRCIVRADNQRNGLGGLDDGVAQRGGGVLGWGWPVAIAVGVEADDGVEVNDAAGLVFSDLDVADFDRRARGLPG